MIAQAVVAAVAAVVLFSKNLMYKVKLFFGLVKHNDEKDDVFDEINIKDSDLENKNSSDS